MTVTLTKGGNVSLSKQAPGLTGVTVGLGWQANTGYELDASALLCDASGKVPSDRHFVFFNNLTSPDGSVRHVGGGSPVDGDDQRIEIDLTRVPDSVEKIVFPVSLYEGAARGQSFGQVHRAHIRVLDREDGAELARYDLATGGLADETALVFGELYRHGAQWKFRAVGQGYASGLAGIAADYGVDVLKAVSYKHLRGPETGRNHEWRSLLSKKHSGSHAGATGGTATVGGDMARRRRSRSGRAPSRSDE
ncbi:TerD family protein [Streptomyces mexicanus]|uniref:TerD family protein n=1 Tax=Streptomyces mexicanus TaxID=178566 RepID=UPI002E2AF603|nr:TerD family protein [Streptomyces mexicanus]